MTKTLNTRQLPSRTRNAVRVLATPSPLMLSVSVDFTEPRRKCCSCILPEGETSLKHNHFHKGSKRNRTRLPLSCIQYTHDSEPIHRDFMYLGYRKAANLSRIGARPKISHPLPDLSTSSLPFDLVLHREIQSDYIFVIAKRP
jgi:hypothetical protein